MRSRCVASILGRTCGRTNVGTGIKRCHIRAQERARYPSRPAWFNWHVCWAKWPKACCVVLFQSWLIVSDDSNCGRGGGRNKHNKQASHQSPARERKTPLNHLSRSPRPQHRKTIPGLHLDQLHDLSSCKQHRWRTQDAFNWLRIGLGFLKSNNDNVIYW